MTNQKIDKTSNLQVMTSNTSYRNRFGYPYVSATPAFSVAKWNRVITSSKVPIAQTPSVQDFGTVNMHRYAWNVLNMGIISGVTAVGILAVQSPIKTAVLNHIKSGKFLPSYTGSRLALLQSLYVGTSSAFAGLAAKSLYITNVKAYKPHPDEVRLVKAGYIFAAGAGYTLVNNGPCNFSDLQKALIIPQGFNWKTLGNGYRLIAGGFGIKYTVAVLNMGALCGLESYIADVLPIQNQKVRFASAGAFSGAAAAVVTYPLSVLKDFSLLQSRVIDGQLKNKSTYAVTHGVLKRFASSPAEATRVFMDNAVKQMPMRVISSSVIFAIISGVGNALGVEPLSAVIPERYQPSSGKNRHGFFAGTPLSHQIEIMKGSNLRQP